MLMFSWRQMVWDYHVGTVVVVSVDLKMTNVFMNEWSKLKENILWQGCDEILCRLDEIICRLDEILCRLDEILCRLDEILCRLDEILCRLDEILCRLDEILCRLDEILCRLDEILCRLDDLIFKYACPFSASVCFHKYFRWCNLWRIITIYCKIPCVLVTGS